MPPGTVCNVADRSTATMSELLELVEKATGSTLQVERQAVAAGDARRTGGSSELAERVLGWSPRTALVDGIAAQVDWQRDQPSIGQG